MAEVHFKTDAEISISDAAVKYADKILMRENKENRKLRELVESTIKECHENAGGMEYGMALEKLLEDSKK